MKPFFLSVHQYRQKLLQDFGYASEAQVREYAEARAEHKRRMQMGDFNPFTADPGCKSCGKKAPVKTLESYESSVFSQHGEDGIIERIFKVIGTTDKLAVEIGAEERENNTAALEGHGWRAIRIDGKCGRGINQEWITKDNVCGIMDKYHVPDEFDMFSLDIDGNDYYVMKAFDRFPKVIVLEFNSSIPVSESKAIAYDEAHRWDGTTYYGASLRAFAELLELRGYKLVYVERSATNAFFVRGDAANKFENAGDLIKLWREPSFTHRKTSRQMIDLPTPTLTHTNDGEET